MGGTRMAGLKESMRRLRRGGAGVIVACLAYAALAGTAYAQDSRGTITGTVRDASPGVVPGATVTVTSAERGTTVTAITNESGFFEVPYLIAGTYKVTVELAGFKKYVRDKIELRIADRLELDATLEEVTVSVETPLLETTNASLGSVLDSRRVSELPTPHGDPYALIGLA